MLIRRLIAKLVEHLPPPRVIYDRMGGTPYLSRWYLIGEPPGTDANGQKGSFFGWPDWIAQKHGERRENVVLS